MELKRGLVSFLLVIGCLFNNPSRATECSAKVQPIREGQAAQCSGYLFSPEAESEAYKATQISKLQKEENEILNKRLDLYIKQSDVLAKQLSRKDNTENLYRFAYFGLGVVITGMIAANVNR